LIVRSSPVDDAFDALLVTAAKEDEDDHKSAVSRLRSAGNAHYVQSSDKVDLSWNASTDNVGVAAGSLTVSPADDAAVDSSLPTELRRIQPADSGQRPSDDLDWAFSLVYFLPCITALLRDSARHEVAALQPNKII
jgi:hypothetical protein